MNRSSRSLFSFALVGILSAGLSAQEPPVPVAITQKLDVEKARVYVATLQPHAPSRSTGHSTNRLLLYLDDGTMTLKVGEAAPERYTFKRGDLRWRPASGAYIAENTSDHPIRILEVDLKGQPSGPTPSTPLDAPLVDPAHYTVALDNEQVRVLRVHFGPREKGARHEHILNRVVVYMNDQGSRKADDVGLSGAAVHAEQNDSDVPNDRIAVELK